LSVTIFDELTVQEPVKVAIRKTFGEYDCPSPSMMVGMRLTGPPGARESTFEIVLFSLSRRLSPMR
jgi:hypothetical protein